MKRKLINNEMKANNERAATTREKKTKNSLDDNSLHARNKAENTSKAKILSV